MEDSRGFDENAEGESHNHMIQSTTSTHCQILKDGTEFFSRGTPNLATVIPAMDHIDTTFTNAIQPTSKTHLAIRYALRLAKKTLNKYYSMTDEVEVYRIAMSRCASITTKQTWLTESCSSSPQIQT